MTKVWKKYEGECGTCHAKWFASITAEVGRESYPETFDVECPVPWCGVVDMKCIGHVAINDSGSSS